jgi:GNAT superfamily N-acetyltransferase
MTGDTAITVRRATFSDVDTLVRFNRAIAEETEGKGLALDVLGVGVRAVFEDPSKGFYLVAEASGEPVGSLLVTPEWSDWGNAYYWWVQSVYVRPEYRRRGVYRTLHFHVERIARSAGNVCGLRLYVDSENSTAKAVYERVGMSKSRYEFFESVNLRTPDRGESG